MTMSLPPLMETRGKAWTADWEGERDQIDIEPEGWDLKAQIGSECVISIANVQDRNASLPYNQFIYPVNVTTYNTYNQTKQSFCQNKQKRNVSTTFWFRSTYLYVTM